LGKNRQWREYKLLGQGGDKVVKKPASLRQRVGLEDPLPKVPD
jgi:hypothetical protein